MKLTEKISDEFGFEPWFFSFIAQYNWSAHTDAEKQTPVTKLADTLTLSHNVFDTITVCQRSYPTLTICLSPQHKHLSQRQANTPVFIFPFAR